MRTRIGRGFTLEEVRQAGLSKHFAKTIGIIIDYRRTNKSAESLQRNVARLKTYLEKLVVLPRKEGQPKKGNNGVVGDATEGTDNLVQNVSRDVLPLELDEKKQKSVKVTKEMNAHRAYATLRLEKTNQKWSGKRAKRLEKTD